MHSRRTESEAIYNGRQCWDLKNNILQFVQLPDCPQRYQPNKRFLYKASTGITRIISSQTSHNIPHLGTLLLHLKQNQKQFKRHLTAAPNTICVQHLSDNKTHPQNKCKITFCFQTDNQLCKCDKMLQKCKKNSRMARLVIAACIQIRHLLKYGNSLYNTACFVFLHRSRNGNNVQCVYFTLTLNC